MLLAISSPVKPLVIQRYVEIILWHRTSIQTDILNIMWSNHTSLPAKMPEPAKKPEKCPHTETFTASALIFPIYTNATQR
jgi:hypothetical protein